MAAPDTKQEIVDAFADMVRSDSLRKVRVATLIDKLGINRNTFYYHFANKYEVALYKFRVDLAFVLASRIDERDLISAPINATAPTEMLPYYTHVEIGARTLDFSAFYRALVECVLKDEPFYHKVFTVGEPEFETLFSELYRPAIEADIRFILGGRYLPAPTFDFMATMLVGHLSSILRYALAHPGDTDNLLDDRVNPFWNMPYEALVHGLQMHPVNRLRKK